MSTRSPRHRRLLFALLATTLLTGVLSTGATPATAAPVLTPLGTLTEWTTPGAPQEIAVGPDGALWYTEVSADAIGRITTAGVRTNFLLPDGVNSDALVAAPDGAIWFTEYSSSKIGRITTSGQITEYSAGITPNSHPSGIDVGPDGNLWFVEQATSKVARITMSGEVTEFSTGISVGSGPTGIVPGPDGALWFTQPWTSSIGRITTSGEVTEFSTGISVGSGPTGIVPGPDGALWFTQPWTSSIGRITTSGQVTEYRDGITADSWPFEIAAGPDNALWFTESIGNRIARITTSGQVTEFPVIAGSSPDKIVMGPDRAMWFAEASGYKVGRMTAGVPSAPETPEGSAGNAAVNVTWTAPATDGATAISGYTATASPGGHTCTTTDALGCTVTGLTNGTTYTVTVTATNSYGTGPASVPSAAVTPRTLPGAPTGVTGTAGNAQVTVGWSAPVSNGGATISGYTATASPGGRTCSTGGTLSCTVTGLTNGTTYTFTATATNAAGIGPASTPSAGVTPAPVVTVPGAPRNVKVSVSGTYAVVSWTAPLSNGGSPSRGYRVTSGKRICVTAGAFTCTFAGLSPGTYRFSVTARNAVGTGPAATSGLVGIKRR